jgi:DUF2971 family protein
MDQMPKFLASWIEQQIGAIPGPPELLYHYTDTQGLVGIFKTNDLWATNALYSNDRTEILHSLILLNRIIGEEKKDRAQDPATDMMLIAVEEFALIIEVFLVCFCCNGDLLSQWRAYGPAGGYALGFDSGALRGLASKHVMLAPVVYDEQLQHQLIRDLVRRWREIFQNAEPSDYIVQVRRLGAFVFAQAFSLLAATFKTAAFSEEDEWRLVYRRQVQLKDDSDLKIDFRERKGMLASYAPIPLPGVTTKMIPVRHIVLGPMRDPNLAGYAVARLLEGAGYPQELIRITPSIVPLRT